MGRITLDFQRGERSKVGFLKFFFKFSFMKKEELCFSISKVQITVYVNAEQISPLKSGERKREKKKQTKKKTKKKTTKQKGVN